MERSVEVATGESVAFSYELAGLGSRFLGMAADLAIQLAVLAAALIVFAWIASANAATLGPLRSLGAGSVDKVVRAVLIAVAVVALFLLFFGYFIFFEWRFGGRTPGKSLVGTRVVRDGGFPIDFTSAVVRNVVRILEFGLGFYALSAVCTLLSPLNRRLGDMAAGTIVVRDARFERASRSGVRSALDYAEPVHAELTTAQRELIRRYVERRRELGRTAREALAQQIVAGVRPRLAASFDHLSDDDLLLHLAEKP